VANTQLTGTVSVGNGGTGAATLTSNNVVLGNGTGAVQFVAPGTTANVLTSNGTTWTSTAPAAGGITSVATGNGLSGGTITSTGTLTIAAPSFNSVGSYCFGAVRRGGSETTTYDTNVSAGTGNGQIQVADISMFYFSSETVNLVKCESGTNALSGTWKIMNKVTGSPAFGTNYVPCVAVRFS
jgi:hypothetical protein